MTPETDLESAKLFDQICKNALLGETNRLGIGTLGERTLHRILKNFYSIDSDSQEIKVGRYVADVKRGSEIVEIQTRAFRNLRAKLQVFLSENRVKVVFPIAMVKYVTWLDPETGELSKRRKSPRSGGIYDFLIELYELRPILPLDGLSFDLVWLEMDEFKLLSGRSHDRKHFGAVRYERIPTKLFKITTLEEPEDFSEAFPKNLPEEFTTSEFGKAARLHPSTAARILATLTTIGCAERIGKRGRTFIYKKTI